MEKSYLHEECFLETLLWRKATFMTNVIWKLYCGEKLISWRIILEDSIVKISYLHEECYLKTLLWRKANFIENFTGRCHEECYLKTLLWRKANFMENYT